MIDIDTLKAGPGLDALVSEKVFGHRVVKAWTVEALEFAEACGRKSSGHPPRCRVMGINEQDDVLEDGSRVPPYSVDIAAAWVVLERVQEVGSLQNFGGFGWRCEIHTTVPDHHDAASEADTAPLAICRAALRSVL